MTNKQLGAVQLPVQQICHDALMEKYTKNGETTIEEIRDRVSTGLAAVEKGSAKAKANFAKIFRKTMEDGFVPGGRINSVTGTDIKATMINCFVQPIGDHFRRKEGKPGISTALEEAGETLRRGGGVGYDFSELRPHGAFVGGTQSTSSGPVSFMRVFDKQCETIESAGFRRGAQMGMLRVDHPDVMRFVHAKDKRGELNNFNISAAVTSEFMRAVENDTDFQLVHEAAPYNKEGKLQRESDGKWVYETIRARDLWDKIMFSTYDHAEPGIIFIDNVNDDNNLYYAERIAATNPCGEQPLPPYGCCCLGSVNLTSFVKAEFLFPKKGVGKDIFAGFDWLKFKQTVRNAIRMLDNVLDTTLWPLPEQEAEAMAKRRIGLGFLGLGDMLIMLGIKYNSPEGLAMGARIAEVMRDEAYRASINLAKEKGSFPKFDADLYLKSGFAKRLPASIRRDIKKFGIRNSHLLSIAPTGTISLAFADNASNGIEPPFSWFYNRKKLDPDRTPRVYEVADHAYRLYREMYGVALDEHGNPSNLPDYFVNAMQMSAIEHMQMMQVVQPFVDTSISKTVNVPADYPYDNFKDLYFAAWKAGLKGLATYRPNDILGAVLEVNQKPKEPEVDLKKELQELLDRPFIGRSVGDLPSVINKTEMWIAGEKKSVYLAVGFTYVSKIIGGKSYMIRRPYEFFSPSGQSGENAQWVTTAMRLLSRLARSGSGIAATLKEFREVTWDKGPVRCGIYQKEDGTVVPRFHPSEVAAIGYIFQQMLMRSGYLDEEGNQVNPEHMATVHDVVNWDQIESVPLAFKPSTASNPHATINGVGSGKPCPECGAHSLHKVDGCNKCSNCGYIGSCG